jgi:protein SCO1/2
MKTFLFALMSVLVFSLGCSGTEVAASADRPAVLDRLGMLPDFAFFDHSDKPITASGLKGKVVVLDFFFTSCTGVCPVMTKNMEDLRSSFRDELRVVCLSISVDPARDSQKKLAEYWKNAGGLVGWHFLRGEEKKVYELARNGLSLGASEVPGELLHSDRFVLVDRAGEIRGYYHGTELSDIERLKKDVRTLLQ